MYKGSMGEPDGYVTINQYDAPPPKEAIADAIWKLLDREVHTSLIGRISPDLGSMYLRMDPEYVRAVVQWMHTRYIVGDVAPLVDQLDRIEGKLDKALVYEYDADELDDDEPTDDDDSEPEPDADMIGREREARAQALGAYDGEPEIRPIPHLDYDGNPL